MRHCPFGKMRPRKSHFVLVTFVLLSISLPAFFLTGYTALYWAWVRGNLEAARPYLPWARNFGMLAISGATAAFIILFLPRVFSLSAKTRVFLSLLATVAIALFSEFRNEGKFYFKRLVHFFWIWNVGSRRIESHSSFVRGFSLSIRIFPLERFPHGARHC